jgi:hypothetical protein
VITEEEKQVAKNYDSSGEIFDFEEADEYYVVEKGDGKKQRTA